MQKMQTYKITFLYSATIEVQAQDEQQAREIASDNFTMDQLEYIDTEIDEVDE